MGGCRCGEGATGDDDDVDDNCGGVGGSCVRVCAVLLDVVSPPFPTPLPPPATPPAASIPSFFSLSPPPPHKLDTNNEPGMSLA